MINKWFTCEVIGKTTETRGFIFKRLAYVIALKVFDGKGRYITASHETAFDQYCSLEIGKKIAVNMYSENNGKTWFFSREDAED